MNPELTPDPDENEKFEWPSGEEFEAWLKEDPKHFEAWSDIMERAHRGEYGDLTPELKAKVARALAKRQTQKSLATANAKFAALGELMARPAGSMIAEERKAQASQLLDEAVDAFLETEEPHRSRFLKMLLPIREHLRSIKIED